MNDERPQTKTLALVIVVVVFGGLFVYELLKWSAK
jgi:hypothetical protein